MSASGRFLDVCRQAGVDVTSSRDVWHSLHVLYSEPHRHYHNLRHIESMLARMDEVSPGDTTMELAIWFHDVIYDPRARDNEEQSAAFFVRTMAPHLDTLVCSDVVRLILATDYTREPTGKKDEELLRDMDLAVLASDPEIYQAYAEAVRREYSHVAEEDFRKGRKAVMERFLEGRIFQTGAFASDETRARENIRAEIARLTGTRENP
ncbi:MAG: phosphohydrolase [Verrucomicrobiaceae bacterium]|nr:MAG: phosphohydrolase [Verrucomicrobiaceae bacterium]